MELHITDTEVSPGVRRMLAGLEVTTKAVERKAQAIGGDIAQGCSTRLGGPFRPAGGHWETGAIWHLESSHPLGCYWHLNCAQMFELIQER